LKPNQRNKKKEDWSDNNRGGPKIRGGGEKEGQKKGGEKTEIGALRKRREELGGEQNDKELSSRGSGPGKKGNHKFVEKIFGGREREGNSVRVGGGGGGPGGWDGSLCWEKRG